MIYQINSRVQLRNEFPASLFSILDFGQGPVVGSLPELGREGAQPDIVAPLLVVKATHIFGLNLCHEDGEKKRTNHIRPVLLRICCHVFAC